LAGASISMKEAVQNAFNHLNATADEAIKMATCRVAAAINMDDQLGKIKPGFPASFVTFNDTLTTIETLTTASL
jgi:N-acetylglucosamine-6-phosphate deacetylase